jgi:hypothetical protein
MSDPFQTPADPFMDGAGGAPAIKFTDIGDTCTGVVTGVKERIDTAPDGTPKAWPNGDPMKVYVFELDTDEGERSLWVRGNMIKAVREAVTAAGFRTVVGTKLTVQHHALGEAKKGFSPAKLYRVKAETAPARATAAAAGDEPW